MAFLMNTLATLGPSEDKEGIDGQPLCIIQLFRLAERRESLKISGTAVLTFFFSYEDALAQHLLTCLESSRELCTSCNAALFATWYSHETLAGAKTLVGADRVSDNLAKVCGKAFVAKATNPDLLTGVKLRLTAVVSGENGNNFFRLAVNNPEAIRTTNDTVGSLANCIFAAANGCVSQDGDIIFVGIAARADNANTSDAAAGTPTGSAEDETTNLMGTAGGGKHCHHQCHQEEQTPK